MNHLIKFFLVPILFMLLLSPSVFSQSEETEVPTPSAKKKGPRRVGEISAEDQVRLKTRVESLNLAHFGFGPAWMTKVENKNLFYSISAGKNWEVNETAEIRSSINCVIPSKGSGYLVTAGLGGSYMPLVTDFSPSIGAELGFGTAGASGYDSKTGFAYSLYAGMRFFRTASTQLSVEGFYRSIMVADSPAIYGLQLNLHY